MERHILADQIIVTDDELRRFTLELHVLRLTAKRRMLKHAVARAQSRKAFDDRVRTDLTICADNDICFNDDIRADAPARAQLCARVHNGRRMNLAHARPRWYIKS